MALGMGEPGASANHTDASKGAINAFTVLRVEFARFASGSRRLPARDTDLGGTHGEGWGKGIKKQIPLVPARSGVEYSSVSSRGGRGLHDRLSRRRGRRRQHHSGRRRVPVSPNAIRYRKAQTMAMMNNEISSAVKDAVVGALGVDEDEVTAEATLLGDLGAESIDLLDISSASSGR